MRKLLRDIWRDLFRNIFEFFFEFGSTRSFFKHTRRDTQSLLPATWSRLAPNASTTAIGAAMALPVGSKRPVAAAAATQQRSKRSWWGFEKAARWFLTLIQLAGIDTHTDTPAHPLAHTLHILNGVSDFWGRHCLAAIWKTRLGSPSTTHNVAENRLKISAACAIMCKTPHPLPLLPSSPYLRLS